MEARINLYIEKSVSTKQKIFDSPVIKKTIEAVVNEIINSYNNGGKVLTAGNGGSAADAQHIAAEFVSKFRFDRPALMALALTTNTSILTSVGNDYSHEHVFARQIQAYAKKGDVFLAISTSGNSKNIILASKEAKENGVKVVGLTGEKSSKLDEYCDYLIKVPSAETSIIQESHIMIGHIICGLVEDYFCNIN